jgi:hypothetical protein
VRGPDAAACELAHHDDLTGVPGGAPDYRVASRRQTSASEGR